MSWRLGTPDYWRYAMVCPQCGRLRGWSSRSATERHARELNQYGFAMDAAYAQEYRDGEDETCPHGSSEPELPKRMGPVAKRRRGGVG